MEHNTYTYCLTETAQEDLNEIDEYISIHLSNPEAAIAFLDEFENKADEVCRAPESGRLVINKYLHRNDIRRFLVKNYIAYYLIDDNKKIVVILRVVYNKRNQSDIAKNF